MSLRCRFHDAHVRVPYYSGYHGRWTGSPRDHGPDVMETAATAVFPIPTTTAAVATDMIGTMRSMLRMVVPLGINAGLLHGLSHGVS